MVTWLETLGYNLITYLCVPTLLMSYFLFSIVIVNLPAPKSPDKKGPARVIAVGLSITLFLLIASVLHTLSSLDRNTDYKLVFDQAVPMAMLGIMIGVAFCFMVHWLTKNDLSEILVLGIATLSFLWFYFYFVESWMREIVVVLVIGQAVGIFGVAMFGSKYLPDTGLVWVCKNKLDNDKECGNHNFAYQNTCQCGYTRPENGSAAQSANGSSPTNASSNSTAKTQPTNARSGNGGAPHSANDACSGDQNCCHCCCVRHCCWRPENATATPDSPAVSNGPFEGGGASPNKQVFKKDRNGT